MGLKKFGLFIILVSSVLICAGVLTPALGDPIKPAGHPDQSFAFAESLFGEGDYFRAITEYKRIIFHFPQDKIVISCRFRIGESYYRAKRWPEAVEAFELFIARYPDDIRTPEALYLKGLAEKEMKRYGAARETFALLMRGRSPDLADKAAYQTALVRMEEEAWGKAMEVLKSIPSGSPIHANARTLASGLEEVERLAYKSPETAGLLAAVLPGAGHLYTERPRDAAVAFLLNASFIVAAVELFRKDQNALGGIVTFIEAGWYLGNIYSAVNSAHKYNKRKRDGFLQRLKDETAISLHYNPQQATMNMAMHIPF